MEPGVNTFAYYVVAEEPLIKIFRIKITLPFLGKKHIYGNEYIGCVRWNAWNDKVSPQNGLSHKLAEDKKRELELLGYIAHIKEPTLVRINICP